MHFRPRCVCVDCLRVSFEWIARGRLMSFGGLRVEWVISFGWIACGQLMSFGWIVRKWLFCLCGMRGKI